MSEKMSAGELERVRGWASEGGSPYNRALGALVAHVDALQREAGEAREQVAARDKIIDQLRASHAEEAREWDEHRTAYINDCVRLARAAGFELDDAPEAIADLIARKRRDSQREADGMREALTTIAGGHIDLQFNEVSGRPLWHTAFVQLQSIARAALNVSPQEAASGDNKP